MIEHQHRPRRQFHARLELNRSAYQIMEAAAHMVLLHLDLLDGQYVTKEDLIDHAWMASFFYLDSYDQIKFLFWDAQRCMYLYIRKHVGPSHSVSLDADDEETFPLFDLPSPRALDDPALAAALLDELENMTNRERYVVLEHLLAGRGLREVGRELGLSDERARQILWDVRWRGMGG